MKNIKNMAAVNNSSCMLYAVVKTVEGIKEVVVNSGLSRTLSIQYIKDNVGETVLVKDIDSREARALVKREFFVTGTSATIVTKEWDTWCRCERIRAQELVVSRKQELRLAFKDFNSYYPENGVSLELPSWVLRELLKDPDLGLVYGGVEICVVPRKNKGKYLYYKGYDWYYSSK